MTTRRSMLKLLGIAPAAAIAEAAPSLAGFGAVTGKFGQALAGSHHGSMDVDEADQHIPLPDTPKEIARKTAHNLFLKAMEEGLHAIPEHMMETIIEENSYCDRLDPDLAVNRSFSLSAKMRIQRQRDIQVAIRKTIYRHSTRMKKKAFGKLYGFEIY